MYHMFELNELDYQVRGLLMRRALQHAMPSLMLRNIPTEQVESVVAAGRLSFLFDDEGNFIKDGFQYIRDA